MIGFWTAPRRASAIDRTTVSIRVGSCQETMEPVVMPRPCRPAATRSTRSRNWPKVTVSPSAAISMGWPADTWARRSTSSHMVRAPVSISLVVMTPPSGTTLIAAGGGGSGRAWRAAGAPAGQNGCVARRPVHSEAREAETGGGGGGKKAVGRRRQVRLVAIAVVVILLGWFAVANTRKVQIDFWVFHRQAPLILVILISGLLGALIALL